MNQENTRRTGGISVETAHIFPIIKKWLYSEKDIFLRELVSNAADAVTKHKRLISLGEIEGGDEENYRITVTVDKKLISKNKETDTTFYYRKNAIGNAEEEVYYEHAHWQYKYDHSRITPHVDKTLAALARVGKKKKANAKANQDPVAEAPVTEKPVSDTPVVETPADVATKGADQE